MDNDKLYFETSEGFLVNYALNRLPINVVLDFCFDKNPDIRESAIYVTHNCSELDQVYDFAISACNSASYLRRESGLLILSQLGSKKGYPYRDKTEPLLKKLIDDTSIKVKKSVLIAIGHLYQIDKLENDELINKVTSLSHSKNIDLLMNVAFALRGCYFSKEVLTTLLNLKKHKDKNIQDWAQISIESHKGDEEYKKCTPSY